MGFNTWVSIGQEPLPGRLNIVITRKKDQRSNKKVTYVHSITEALEAAGDLDIFIIGGEQVYRDFLPIATKLYLTVIDTIIEGTDIFFPEFDLGLWELTDIEEGPQGEEFSYTFLTYIRA